MTLKEGSFYKKTDSVAECLLCPHNCILSDGKKGICSVRENKEGKLFTVIYGEVTSAAMDPIEKKPLYHFYPGTKIFSIGTKGCNLSCPFCQNWSISQSTDSSSRYFSSEDVVRTAATNDSVGIAYTYSEPIIWFEYVKDTALLAKEKGLKNVLVTNGFINQAPLEEMLGFIDAMNIDLKCYNSNTYSKKLKGKLDPVKETIKTAYQKGCFIEITTLIVMGLMII
jgi:pyruvate formate lyase activating enzyme